MAKKINQLTAQPSTPADTDLVAWGQASGSGIAYKMTFTQLKAKLDAMGGGGDVTAPTVVSKTVTSAAPGSIVVVFSESVTVTTAGWSAKKNGSAWSISSVSGSGTTWTFVMGSSAAGGDTLLISYDSTTGATVDTATNELVSFTDSAVTNAIFGGTPLTWGSPGSLASDHEQWNSSLSIRRKAAEANDWENEISNVSVSNQTFTGGDRLVFTLAEINKTFIVAFRNSSFGAGPAQLVGSAAEFGLTTDSGGSTGLIQAWEAGAAVGTTHAGSTAEYYAIFLDSGGFVRYQYSTDGSTWTTFYTSAGSGSGSYYAHVQIYHSNFGPNGLYKL
jgi:hypothetical protein